MKQALVGMAVLGCVAATPANAAFILWQGDLFIISANTAACTAVNMQQGDFARFVFRPKNVPGSTNGTSDLLSFSFSRSSGQIAPNGGNLDTATLATLRTIGGSAGFSQIPNSGINAVVVPAAPAAAAPSVSITITINNIFSGSSPSGCNPTFKGVLSRRP
jgi:hypothetical protein